MAKQIEERTGIVIVQAKNRTDLDNYIKNHPKLKSTDTRYIDKKNAKRMFGIVSGRVYHVKKKRGQV